MANRKDRHLFNISLASSKKDDWNVVIQSEDDTKRRFYILSPSTSLGDVLMKFTDDVGLTCDDGAFVDDDGSSIPDDLLLTDVGEIALGRRTTFLTFQEKENMLVEVLGGAESSRPLRCRPGRTPASLLPEIRRLLGPVSQGRELRLRSGGVVLDLQVPLELQRHCGNSTLLVEFGMSLEFHEVWDGFVIEMESVFPTDKCRDVLVEVLAAIQRSIEESGCEASKSKGNDSEEEKTGLQSTADVDHVKAYHDGMELVFRGDVLEALSWSGAPWQRGFRLRLETKRGITLMKGCTALPRQMWPLERVGKLAEGRALMCGERILNEEDMAWDLDLAEGGLVIEEPIIVTLYVGDGKRIRVRTPKWATVGDFRRVAQMYHRTKQVHLRRRRTVFDDDNLTLSEAGIAHEPSLMVDTDLLTISVRMGQKCVTWCPQKRQLNFKDLITDIAREAGIRYSVLQSTVFQCTGCSRRIWREEESGQTIPLKCCSTESRSLCVWLRPKEDLWTSAEMAATWTLIQENAGMKEDVDYLGRQLKNIKRIRAKLGKRVKTLEYHLQIEKKTNLQLTEEKKDLSGRCQQHLTLNEALQGEIEELRKKIQKQEATSRDLIRENKGLKKQFEESQLSNSKLAKENKTLKERLQHQEMINHERLQENQKLKKQSDQQRGSISELTKENRNLKEKRQKKERMYSDQLQQNEELKKKYEQQRVTNAEITKENKALKKTYERERRPIDPLEMRRRALDLKEQSLNAQLKELKENVLVQGQQMQTYFPPVPQETHAVEGATGEEVREAGKTKESSFYIHNRELDFNGGKDFTVCLSLSFAPTVGELRAAIALHVGTRPERTGLRRFGGQADGDPVFHVGGGFRYLFADAEGNVRRSVKDKKESIFIRDADPFVVVPGRDNHLIVFPHLSGFVFT